MSDPKGDCGECSPPATGPGLLAAGVAGLAKAALGIDAAPPAVVQARRDACRACDRATRNPAPRFAATAGLTVLSRCTACSCFLAPKTRLASERCPLGRWPT